MPEEDRPDQAPSGEGEAAGAASSGRPTRPRFSLAAKLRALAEQHAAPVAPTAGPAPGLAPLPAAPTAALPGASVPAAPTPEPTSTAPGGVHRSSLRAKLQALAAGAAAAAPVTAPPASPSPAMPPAARAQAAEAPAAPAAPSPAAPAGATARERIAARLARLGLAPSAATAALSAAAPPSPPTPPAIPTAEAGGTALATDRIARRLRGEAPPARTVSGAPAVAPARPPLPPEPSAKARTRTPYLPDSVFLKLPEAFQRIVLETGREEGVRPAVRVLRALAGPELERQRELLDGFIENMRAVLRVRFVPEDIEKYVFLDHKGDLTYRFGDGEVMVRAKCWEFFFLHRTPRPLGPDRLRSLQDMLEECFTFSIEDTAVCPMKLLRPVEFEKDDVAQYFEASLEIGGWCDMRFEGAAAFTDGRLLVATFTPRVVRGRDIPPPTPISPKQFVELLKKSRRR